MKEAVFVTGGTGFLGTQIVKELVCGTDNMIYVLVRAKDEKEAFHRLKAAWFHARELVEQIGLRIFPVTGDFTVPGLGMQADMAEKLRKEVRLIFHVGAEVGLQKPGSELFVVNKEGTEQVLAFAQTLLHLGRFVYVSTAYVAGLRSGRIMEDERVSEGVSEIEAATEAATEPAISTKTEGYCSLYEQSKAEAEALVRATSLPWSICRPGMIVGHSETGRVKNFNTIYYVLKQMLTGKLPVLPVRKDLGLNLVPVDYVAKSVVTIGLSREAEGQIYHLTCPEEMQPKVEELVSFVRSWAKENLGLKLARPVYAPLPGLKKAGLSYNRKAEDRKKSSLTNMLTLMPYFYGDQVFDRSNTDSLLGTYMLEWKDYIQPLLAFACRKNFMQQTERTVFEQANVRRESRHYPIHYYDVSAAGIRRVSGEKVNRRIRKIHAALWAWGIRKGDKVALTGINSVDYMMLDQAIGLIGAVSVPIYYTTPIEEAELLLKRSGVEWFFVGDQRIMSSIEKLNAEIRVVTFSAAQEITSPRVMRWETFLAKGRKPAPVISPDPEDLATIRYTSGTTGEPKGVMFNFHQLAWMGEVLTNLLSWSGRNKEMRYLSFLPESHVVEGILASYAPYYMLAKVDFYFLNDFGALVETLPKVRPTVFFSVPRFYEKLWDQLAANPIGKQYLTMQEGPAKRATAAILKKVILKKAGLDACEQLIVGSAPISEALLNNFRALGIEIHNAYGQTEAPLITINRLGDNVIPTIGTPLPETEVKVEADGELIVTGPQVCLGYYGLETDTITYDKTAGESGMGVLKTGDLGRIDENGHITLFGRKKEMIITAYGKNISTPKIEERLKNIPAVSEAVLIGENRPYCTALLWLEGEAEDLDQQIEAMNADLSHPEQVRKYKIIETPLSIQKGELTPNLKVKRGVVEEHYSYEIQEMYQ